MPDCDDPVFYGTARSSARHYGCGLKFYGIFKDICSDKILEKIDLGISKVKNRPGNFERKKSQPTATISYRSLEGAIKNGVDVLCNPSLRPPLRAHLLRLVLLPLRHLFPFLRPLLRV